MRSLLTSGSPGLLAGLAALCLAACNPFTNNTGGEGQACKKDGSCLSELFCCNGLCSRMCDADADGYNLGADQDADCDDGDASIHPGAIETCNGLDDDCDSDIDEAPGEPEDPDPDGDGYEACDCAPEDPLVNPGVEEICNSVDDNCDGQIDEGLTDQPCERTNPAGTCTGVEICDRGIWVCSAAIPEPDTCDGRDNDCDGQTDMPAYACEKQDGVCAGAAYACLDGVPSPDPSECDYGPEYQAGDEDRCDLLDNDCDGLTDEDLQPSEPELGVQASDGLDNNCNGLVDEPGGLMVEVIGLAGRRAWIDVYEATIFDNPDCTGDRYGAANDDYPAGWPMSGSKQIDLYACSLADLIPSGSLSRVRAARACQAQGKRLCTRGEWVLGCATAGSTYPWGGVFLPDDICNDALSGPNTPVAAGAFGQCTGDDNTFDMIGNLAEWVSDVHPTDPAMGLLGGGSYALVFCLFDAGANTCYPVDLQEQLHLDFMGRLSNCVIGDEQIYGFLPTEGRPEFGVRCCLDGP